MKINFKISKKIRREFKKQKLTSNLLPLTFKTEEYEENPAELFAVQVYSPACSKYTESMVI